ncbi:MAG: helix-turn-helix domain-containing protein [Rhodocyclaceae bacterium]|nr:helix-turn-helix domain-containing protein [Rhodocyclaceae bacterium]
MDMIDLGNTIKTRRKVLRLSQQAVAAPLGMSRVTLSHLENGKLPELGLRKIMAICSTLGLELVVREASPRPTLRDLIAEREKC